MENMKNLSKDDTLKFQTFYNDSLAAGKTPLSVDGIAGPKTNAAYKEMGKAFENRITLKSMFFPKFTVGSLIGIGVAWYGIHLIKKHNPMFKAMKPTILIPLEIGILVIGNTIGQAVQNKIEN